MKLSLRAAVVFSSLVLSVLSAIRVPYNITVDSIPSYNKSTSPALGTPVCLDRSNIPQSEMHWLYMPSSPNELATRENYGYLSGQLINSGVVDASDCPLNGVWPTGYANACGLEKTRQASLYLQNVYDDEILAAGKNIGVPPVMIKQLIRYESQFWPVRFGFYHYGLGHLTYLGAQNALQWSRDLYDSVASQAYPGSTDYAIQLLSLMDASCPTCPNKINIPKAEKSISYLAQILMGYCKQTSQVVSNATERNPGEVVTYPTIWRLTLLNYNAGPMCVYDAVRASYKADKPEGNERMTWISIVERMDRRYCLLGLKYVDNITAKYYGFR